MGWSIGFDSNWRRDVGYGVPAHCDHPGCKRVINRGLAYVCGGDVYGGTDGCGLFFCDRHGGGRQCARCLEGAEPFDPRPEHPRWARWKLAHHSWGEWRAENPDAVAALAEVLEVARAQRARARRERTAEQQAAYRERERTGTLRVAGVTDQTGRVLAESGERFDGLEY